MVKREKDNIDARIEELKKTRKVPSEGVKKGRPTLKKPDERFWITKEPKEKYDCGKRAMLVENDEKITGAEVELIQLDKDKAPHILASIYLDTEEFEIVLKELKKGAEDKG